MFISRFLLVAVLAYLFNLLMVKCAPPPPNSQYHLNPKPLTRNCTLFHKCSGGFLEIRNKKILAKPITMSRLKYVQLELITDVTSSNLDELGLKIYNPSVDRYMCFNQKGKLITRFVYKEEYCKFKDFMGESTYSEFRLVSRPDWRVGFNTKGRALVAESTGGGGNSSNGGGGGGSDKDKQRRPNGGVKVNRNCLSFIPQCGDGGSAHQVQHHHLRHHHHNLHHVHHLKQTERHHPSSSDDTSAATADSRFSAMLSARVQLQSEQKQQKQNSSRLQRHNKSKDKNKS